MVGMSLMENTKRNLNNKKLIPSKDTESLGRLLKLVLPLQL